MRRHLPLLAYKHAYVVTEPIPGLEGLPSIRDYNAAVYMKTSGEALHIGGYELDPIRLKTQSGWDMEQALEISEMMLKQGVVLDMITYIAAFSACENSQKGR